MSFSNITNSYWFNFAYTTSGTQTDESDVEDQPAADQQDHHMTSLQQELEAVKAELQATKTDLVKCQADAGNSLQDLKREVDKVKLERDQYQKLDAERLILSNFSLEQFSTDNELIKLYTGFPTYKHILFFMNL